MDTAHQPQTPTTPTTFCSDSSPATQSGFSPIVQPPASPTKSNDTSHTTTTSADTTTSNITTQTITNHPTPLHTRRLLRCRRRLSPYPQSCSTRQSHRHSNFSHLLRPLHPLVSIETGLAHPSFPRSILAYHLLSHSQLDTLAANYHQLVPSAYSLGYPTTVVGRWGARDGDVVVRDQHFEALVEEARGVLGLRLGCEDEMQWVEDKRRRFGRFVGLSGCESPGVEDEGVMRWAMEMWVDGEMGRKLVLEREREGWERKGAW